MGFMLESRGDEPGHPFRGNQWTCEHCGKGIREDPFTKGTYTHRAPGEPEEAEEQHGHKAWPKGQVEHIKGGFQPKYRSEDIKRKRSIAVKALFSSTMPILGKKEDTTMATAQGKRKFMLETPERGQQVTVLDNLGSPKVRVGEQGKLLDFTGPQGWAQVQFRDGATFTLAMSQLEVRNGASSIDEAAGADVDGKRKVKLSNFHNWSGSEPGGKYQVAAGPGKRSNMATYEAGGKKFSIKGRFERKHAEEAEQHVNGKCALTGKAHDHSPETAKVIAALEERFQKEGEDYDEATERAHKIALSQHGW